jgi:hypothetical protein
MLLVDLAAAFMAANAGATAAARYGVPPRVGKVRGGGTQPPS